ncbi:MAG: GIY-YIG nuclease family protein [Rickettsiales bacterium]|nr:GIY-YIG nuclease family protein [Rickettsiales bacterium]
MENTENSSDNDLFIHSPFWQTRLESLSHPVAVRMAQDLDAEGFLGIGDANKSFWKGFKHGEGKKDSNIDFLLRIKKQHPQKIVLIQIGEFYETWGIDSVFLVEHCGINRMGRKGPRAGMPLANIQSVLDDLTYAGFSIVVCEQVDDAHRKGRKIRFISEIITPASPTYTYGLAMSHKANICFPETPPEFGVAANSKGIKVVEINPDLRTSLTLEGLTEEAAIIRLNKYSGRLNRIFLHDKTPKSLLSAINLKFHNLVKIQGYSSHEFANRMEELIKIDLGLDANISFLKTTPLYVKNSPNPLYQQTAEQIGILPKRGIPDLISLMLPKGSPATCKYIVRNILLNPPPIEYANSLREAIIELQASNKQLPTLIVSNPARYIKTLNKNEAHPEILKDLFCLAEIFLTCEKNLSKDFIKNSLEIVSYISSIRAEEQVLSDVSKKIMKILSPILPLEEDLAYVPKNELIPITLFERVEEEFRGRIARTSSKKISHLYDEIEKAAKKYEEVLEKKLIPVIETIKKESGKAKRIALSFDIHNNAIWMLGSVGSKHIEEFNLIHPIDRYGKEVKDRWSVKEVEEVLATYKEIAIKTYEAIKEILKEASKELSPYCLPIIHLATFSNLVKTIYLHIKECKPRNWTTNFVNQKSETHKIHLEEFFPYWMKAGEAVENSMTFNGTCLLTGHNMSGKSTLIRSLAASTLLASSGFMFPAKNISLSEEIDGWFVRTGAGDDPEAGLSAFAVEMTDIKVALRDATNKSFLLIDELGKGTESRAGHAIAASVLEHLEARNIRAIFATHWHEIFANKIVNLENVKLIKMHCDGNVPSYKVADGMDLNSSAFYTAEKVGVNQEIIKRAEEIAVGYDNSAISRLEDSKQEEFIYSDKITLREMLAADVNNDISQIKHLKENEIPALNDIGHSVIYILKTSNNFFYVGETDNFLHRIMAHRNRIDNAKCEFFYISIKEGKSHARQIEQKLITKLKNKGFPMLSISDAENLNFGVKGDV